MKTQCHQIARAVPRQNLVGEPRILSQKSVDVFDPQPPRQRPYVPPHSDTSVIKSFLRKPPQTVRNLHGGDNDVFLVDNEWIFRFPKHESARQANIREQTLLKALKPQIRSTEIPIYEFWDEGKGIGGYREIRGHNLSRALVQGLGLQERSVLARDLACVLSELHSFPVEQLSVELAHGEEKTLQRLSQLSELLKSDQLFSIAERAMIDEACSLVKSHLSKLDRSHVLLHGDLHCDNIIFDGTKKRLAGLIDFSDAVRGPALIDLVGLYRASPRLADEVQRHYAMNMGLNVEDLQRDCRALALILFSREVLLNQHPQGAQSIRRLARSGYVIAELFESGWTGSFRS